ncbi:hypothetical protein MCEMRE130_01286 [Candidatus Nanopelagicaceae bacterium]
MPISAKKFESCVSISPGQELAPQLPTQAHAWDYSELRSPFTLFELSVELGESFLFREFGIPRHSLDLTN